MKYDILHEKHWSVDLFYLGLITSLLSGCGDPGLTDLQEYVAEIKAIENPHVDPIPEYRHIPPFFYEVQNQRDPFIPLIDTDIKKPDIPGGLGENKSDENPCPSHPDANRVRVGLEEMPLDALQMVGTMTKEGTLWALVVSTSDGTLYHVKQNDYLGENYGQIINISEDQIDILELLPDGNGCWTQEVTTLRLASQTK
ncbi:type 4 fimbrial biogenesis protein PilP [Candidatus Thiomargarita nelsonii]|uniref:Type 4 fimbrial biogenesis protein PilP n=1 Tax=Candidatus Thiomargarita nelsonii TaxID=1003181 RepID=A0A176S731_9GAMM|nr:type 4 fimbrial biogenesis protein PilP [Candidatus Thiomargarita nelsonii]